MHKLIGARLPESRQIGLREQRYARFQFVLGQGVQHDQTFALLLVGNCRHSECLFAGSAEFVQLVFHFDVRHHFTADLAETIALLYFQFPNEWMVTAWAAVVFVLFGFALWLDRPLFLHQLLLLTLGVCSRGVMHNLFGASYFTGGHWTGRYFVLGAAIALLLACLPFAFQWRDRYRAKLSSNWFGALMRHPEQFMFFAPIALLTLMLAIHMRAGMVTVAWGVEALSIMVFAFVIKERSFRLTGFLLLIASFGKILLLDMWSRAWTWRDRYITFVIVGVAMVSASFLYNKYSEKIRQFL